jgi:hypothetical protein
MNRYSSHIYSHNPFILLGFNGFDDQKCAFHALHPGETVKLVLNYS